MQHRSILTGGFLLTLRHWPALVWTYVFNLGLAVLLTLPLHGQISAITAQSFASQRLVGAFDLGVMLSLLHKLGQGPGSAASASYLSTPLYLALFFLIVPGTLFCYQTAAPARLSALLQLGIRYFWRFVRITLVSLLVFGVILGGLIALQKVWAGHVDPHTVGRAAFLEEFAGVIVIGLVAAALRVYFDLVEIYTVQLGLLTFPANGEKARKANRQTRRVFRPAWETFRQNFLRAYFSFILLTLLGLSAVIVTARIAMHLLAQPHVWPMFLLAQAGLFFMLFTRFWQRGADTILALDHPILAPPAPQPEPAPPQPPVVESVPMAL